MRGGDDWKALIRIYMLLHVLYSYNLIYHRENRDVHCYGFLLLFEKDFFTISNSID